jgi:predicted  nucleic acid-binding Zn-ribbon protein
MKLVYSLFIFSIVITFVFAQSASPPPSSGPSNGLSSLQWEAAYDRLEAEFILQTTALTGLQKEMIKEQEEMHGLDSQVAKLRHGQDPGVFDQIRLNHLLNDLKDHLEKNAVLQRQWTDSQKEHQQKGLSLISLLNDRIEGLLEMTGTNSSALTTNLTTLSKLAQKRRQIQETLQRFESKKERSVDPPLSAFRSLGTNDLESLEMTLDLLKERQKALEEENQRLSLEANGIQGELKLQKKMKDFLIGIKRMNQDSGSPPEGFERSHLSGLYSGRNPEKLSGRLEQIQMFLSRNRSTGDQINHLISNVQERMNSLKERKLK